MAEFPKRKLGQPVVVVNKTGGGGLTGSPSRPRPSPTATRCSSRRPGRTSSSR
ncbi:MAG: hypothetical protein ACLSHC_06730 [Bilophila wadsworthia]